MKPLDNQTLSANSISLLEEGLQINFRLSTFQNCLMAEVVLCVQPINFFLKKQDLFFFT